MLKATLRSFFAHKGRMALSALAVLLSVAFVAGTLIFSDTLSRTFDHLFSSTSADVTVGPRREFDANDERYSGTVATLPASLAARAAKVDGVAAAHVDVAVGNTTVVDRRNRPVGPTTGAPTLALNWYRSDRSPVEITSGRAPGGPGETVIDADTAHRRHVRIGDTLRVVAAPGTFPAKVVGIATFTTTNPGAALLFFDTPTAQARLLGRTGAATAISVDAAPGVGNTRLKQRLAADLGPGYEIRTQGEQAKTAAEQLGSFLDVLKYALLGFAGIAVLVGVFLILNTFSMLVAQRTRELGLLRAVGASRRQVNRSVLVEALLLGLVGSTLGLAAGFGLALLLMRLIGKAGVSLKASELVFNWPTPVAAYTVGVLVTMVSAYLPARRAGRTTPMAALAEAGVPPSKSLRLRTAVGAVVTAAGAAALAAAATGGRAGDAALMLGAGVVLTLIGMVVLGPLLARPVVRTVGGAFPAVFGAVGRISQRNALRNPRRTGATAAALMIGLALVGGLTVVGTSMAGSIDQEIDQTLGADYTVQNGVGRPFPPQVTERVRSTPGVGTVIRERVVPARIEAGGHSEKVLVIAADPELDQGLRPKYRAGSTARGLAPGRIVVNGEYADKRGLGIGDSVSVRFSRTRSQKLTIGAITPSQKNQAVGNGTNPVIGMDTLERNVPGVLDAVVMADAAPGTDKAHVRTALEKALASFPQVQVRDQADYKDLVRGQINVLLGLVYGLLGLAIVIAVLGVVNTLALSVIERTREIGLLRAIGLSRRQLRRMIRLESVVIAVFGALLGLALGLGWGVAAQRILALKGMKVLEIPWPTILTVMVGSVVIGLVAALLPALRASRMNVLAAIAHE
ncbi:ABC transporter permease [Wenjunlia tyrosinilytica]|uniref:Membrane protein n=1 Tax=Wenjunlia tyrosinilytica TaxID=1544741 RepID=A0A917ZLC8_9ACTN|nr:ABC transporter permease [Wenjunlia tyrosinilytica]GGO84036.1 membrane protein [Wenjunlia tyrosinilytica]